LPSVAIPVGLENFGYEVFSNCTSLTDVTIFAGVGSIGVAAFLDCTALTSVEIRESLVSIGDRAFSGCNALASITMPASLESIGNSAFFFCRNLKTLIFKGDAPEIKSNVFYLTASELTIYYLSGSTGFTTPKWQGHPSVMLDESTLSGSYLWLLEHGFAPNTPLSDDPNHDGVDLLMAWALGLDPNRNLAGALPRARLVSNALEISFRASNPDVVYTVETSTDMRNWTSEGVNLSGSSSNPIASVPRDAPRRFLRLVVEEK
jgi:hypothetical protein